LVEIEEKIPVGDTKPLLPQPQKANISSVEERMEQELNNMKSMVLHFLQQHAHSKEAIAVTVYTEQVKDVISNLSKNGNSSQLTKQAITLLEKMNQLAKDMQLSQQAVKLLNMNHTMFLELKEHLVKRAKDLQAQLDQLKQVKEQLENRLQEVQQPTTTQEPNEEIEMDFQEEEKGEEPDQESEKEFEELTEALKSSMFTSELAQEAQQAIERVQDATQAQELASGVAELIKQMESKAQKLQVLSLSDIEGEAEELVDQELQQLKQDLKNTKTSLAGLCKKHNLPEPDTKPELPISKETLKGAFNQALDMLLPASDLVKIALGTKEMPTNNSEWVRLAMNTVLDFMPGGKIFKFLKGNSARFGMKKIESQILKIAAKKAKKVVSIPKGFNQTKKFGYQHGQKVYEYKGKYYSIDADGHGGGVWKVFEEIGGKLKRIGTADEKLTIFKN